jgi:hypothetical protein
MSLSLCLLKGSGYTDVGAKDFALLCVKPVLK